MTHSLLYSCISWLIHLKSALCHQVYRPQGVFDPLCQSPQSLSGPPSPVSPHFLSVVSLKNTSWIFKQNVTLRWYSNTTFENSKKRNFLLWKTSNTLWKRRQHGECQRHLSPTRTPPAHGQSSPKGACFWAPHHEEQTTAVLRKFKVVTPRRTWTRDM